MKILHITKKGTPQGDLDLKLAFNGKYIGIKGKSNPTAQQFISQFKSKGAIVIEKREGFLVNIFPEGQTLCKLGRVEIDFEKDNDIIVENKLCQFYIDVYSKAGFEVE